jgi:Domain of unknown function (DUF4304)
MFMPNKTFVVEKLDAVQSSLGELLPNGFRKRGRNFNRLTEEGIVQVINLQVGPYEIGPPLPDDFAHLRPNLYGQFTVNLGVFVKECYEFLYNPAPKGAINETHCRIRRRLNPVDSHKQEWWSLSLDLNELVDDVGGAILYTGIPFLERFSTRECILTDWIPFNETDERLSNVAHIDVAMILLAQGRREEARSLLREQIKATEMHNHIEYVRELSEKLGLGSLD